MITLQFDLNLFVQCFLIPDIFPSMTTVLDLWLPCAFFLNYDVASNLFQICFVIMIRDLGRLSLKFDMTHIRIPFWDHFRLISASCGLVKPPAFPNVLDLVRSFPGGSIRELIQANDTRFKCQPYRSNQMLYQALTSSVFFIGEAPRGTETFVDNEKIQAFPLRVVNHRTGAEAFEANYATISTMLPVSHASSPQRFR